MKKFMKWGAVILFALVGIIMLVLYQVYADIKKTTASMQITLDQPLNQIEKPIKDLSIKTEPFSVLLLGVDERQYDHGRSDTIIVATVNPQTQSTKMLSIPRDTRVTFPENGSTDKLNHAYSYGGIALTLATVEQLLDIPIDYVVKINMEGFISLVDELGPIHVNNDFAFDYEWETFEQGDISLTGERALKYVRMRYDDPQGDFGRQNRQKDVVQGILMEAIQLETTFRYRSILQTLENNVEMTLTFEDIIDLAKNYRSAIQTFDSLHFEQGTGQKIDGIYYYLLQQQELESIQNELHQHLQIQPTSTTKHTTTVSPYQNQISSLKILQ
jgi:polyisoprenyl-teichoic acid--peptidoglycan teichoic acid transferase